MNSLGISSVQKIFDVVNQGSYQLENLANSALSQGIDRYMNADYQGAVKEFQRAVGLAQTSPYSVDAANYMAQAYLKLGDVENAIKAYRTAIRLDPSRDDSHLQLGNLYYAEERYDEAVTEYRQAVKINPTAGNLYALGQAFLGTGSYNDAQEQFKRVLSVSYQEPAGYYGLGLTYSRQGLYEDALRQFNTAIQLDPELYDAYAEIGYTYADMGFMDEAQKQVDFLEKADPALADTLSRYMYKVDPPKILFAHSSGTFPYTLGNNMPVSMLDSYLENGQAEKTFTMVFQFDKQMDRESVEDILNWQIRRSTISGPGRAYNFGQPIASTEISVAPYPQMVCWNQKTLTATVYFKIQQNAAADGTIDPSHIEFKFGGDDIYGLAMDQGFDQFIGFSGVV
jgi:tetratricopeptide (TPR) repeat protein